MLLQVLQEAKIRLRKEILDRLDMQHSKALRPITRASRLDVLSHGGTQRCAPGCCRCCRRRRGGCGTRSWTAWTRPRRRAITPVSCASPVSMRPWACRLDPPCEHCPDQSYHMASEVCSGQSTRRDARARLRPASVAPGRPRVPWYSPSAALAVIIDVQTGGITTSVADAHIVSRYCSEAV